MRQTGLPLARKDDAGKTRCGVSQRVKPLRLRSIHVCAIPINNKPLKESIEEHFSTLRALWLGLKLAAAAYEKKGVGRWGEFWESGKLSPKIKRD